MRGPVPVRVAGLSAPPACCRLTRDLLDLGPAVVSPALLPMRRLNRSIRLALSAFADHAVRYEDPRGSLRLRRQIARLVFRQGATCSADDVVVTSGSTEALNLTIRAVTSPAASSRSRARAATRRCRCSSPFTCARWKSRMCHSKASICRCSRRPSRAIAVAAIITIATCHNPMGDCVTDDHKARIVAFAERHDIPIIESDTFGDLVFAGPRPRALKAFDTSGHRDAVLLAGPLRRPRLQPGMGQRRTLAGEGAAPEEASPTSPTRDCRSWRMAEFLESGAFDTHLRDLRVALWRAVDAAREEVLRTFPPAHA